MADTRRTILESIATGPQTGPELADSLDISRAAIWKHIEELRSMGFDIDSNENGYELKDITQYNALAVELGLEAPFSVEYHETIVSTNERARELAIDGADNVVVLADEQTGGRGRLDRSWKSPSGGVWMSIVCRPTLAPARAPLYTLVAAVATTRAAREVGVDAQIKWPNDVIVPQNDGSYRKLAGILTEMEGETDRIEWIVVGIGVNVNVDPDDLRESGGKEENAQHAGSRETDTESDIQTFFEGPTSIHETIGDVDRRIFVQRILEEFSALQTDFDRVLTASTQLSATIGTRVRIDRPQDTIVGNAVDITDTGALVVESADGLITVATGDCEHLRPV